MATWRQDIIAVMEELGGDASNADIYAQLALRRRRPLSEEDKVAVRTAIRSHSSDSDTWTSKRPDLFYSVGGKGSGRWGLRRTNPT